MFLYVSSSRIADLLNDRNVNAKLQTPTSSADQSSKALSAAGSGRRVDSDMQGGLVDEFLDVAVERPVLDQFEVEIGRPLEDRLRPF